MGSGPRVILVAAAMMWQSLRRLRAMLPSRGRSLPDLETRIACFREVLHANNTALGVLAEIQRSLAGERQVTAADVRRLVAGVTVQTYRMIVNLRRMTGGKYPSLPRTFERLRRQVAQRADVTPFLGTAGYVVRLEEAGASHAQVIGQKSAALAEARRVLGERVPTGFATTVAAYQAFMAGRALAEEAAGVLRALDPADVPACFAAAARLTQMVEAQPVPADVAAAIESEVERLLRAGHRRFAVRSSALEEDGHTVSFAGQYRSLLNVEPAGVVDAFRLVVASKYSPQAIAYRLSRGFDDADVAMCCCVIPMVEAHAAGVAYTAFPVDGVPRTVVQAVRGLGIAAVDGSVEPDSFVFDRQRKRLIAHKRGLQREAFHCAATEGTVRVALVGPAAEAPPIREDEALAIAALAWRLEETLGEGLDVEWAIAPQGEALVLQVRPQSGSGGDAGVPTVPPLVGERVLLAGGARASGGVACGVVVRVRSDLDILRCPAGAVVVTDEADPRLAVLLPKAAAVVADMGEVTGHLATVARELGVPALFAAREATARLTEGELVSVDADAGVVYAGRVEAALARHRETGRERPASPHLERLAAVSAHIVPLTLRDRLASGYSPRRCRTMHDIIRFCHQATIEEMFALGDRALQRGTPVKRLVSPVPIDCRVVDLGGGVRPGAGPEISIDDVDSVPMRALWQGLTDPRLRWQMTRPVSLKGFLSAVVNYNFDQDLRTRAMGEPSYVFVAREYVNLNSRIGYHFSTVDARVSEVVESNYASFRFVGGSTQVEQRSRRALLIQRILTARGFETDRRADLVNARLRHRPAAEMEAALTTVGLLMGFVNHLDMALTSDALVDVFERAFLEGRYGYKGGEDAANG